MKRLIPLMMAVLLSLTLLPSAVLAADGSLAHFKTDAQAPAFSDVSTEDWFCDSVETVSKAGLMIGIGKNRFAPDADITLAEVYTIAARLHAIYFTGSAEAADEYDNPPDKPWSYGYVKYCMDKGIMPGEPGDVAQPASRVECASLLARAMSDKELTPINAIADNAIPDLSLSPDKPNAADVYKLYRAGVLTGMDSAGTFYPESRIRRCEVAAIVARLIDPERRRVLDGLSMSEEFIRQTREQIDAAYDAFLAAHYELENMESHLAAYATRRLDLNGDGWNELVVYRMPAEAYPLDIYEYDRSRGEVLAFCTSLEGIPASLNADPDGDWCAAIGAHGPDSFYGDFFSVNGKTFLISQNAAEFFEKIVCHAFTSVSGSLAAQTVFSAERYGEFVADETKKNKAFVNGQEIPYNEYNDAVMSWRQTWEERMGESPVILVQTPIWGEFELSGWPFGWLNRPRVENGTAEYWTAPTGLFSLNLPEGFFDAVEVRTGEQWEGGSDEPEYWASFKLKDPGDGDGVLGSLVLYPHMLERYYFTGRQEYATLTFSDGRSYEFVFVLPEDPALNNPSYPAGIYGYYLSQLRTAAASAKFPEGTRVTVSPGNAADMLATALIKAYNNTYGHEPMPLAEDPSPCDDETYLRYAINRILTGTLGEKGSWEDDDFYWYPVIFPFAVDKESGAIYKVYEGWDPATNSEHRQFTPFNWNDPDALTFAG